MPDTTHGDNTFDNPDDTQEFVPLPDINDNQPDDYFYGGDPTLWDGHSVETESSHSDEELIPDTAPFYANQMEDPEVQQMEYEFQQYIDGLFK